MYTNFEERNKTPVENKNRKKSSVFEDFFEYKINYPKHTCSFSIKSMYIKTQLRKNLVHLAKRLDNKKSILQFFTKCLYDISTIKHFNLIILS
jgi:hypothetical protein